MIAASQRTLEESARRIRSLVENKVQDDAVNGCEVDNVFIGDANERNRPSEIQFVDGTDSLTPTSLGGKLAV